MLVWIATTTLVMVTALSALTQAISTFPWTAKGRTRLRFKGKPFHHPSVMAQSSEDATPAYTMRTNEATPQYLVAKKGQQVLCTTDAARATTFDVLPGLAGGIGRKSLESDQFKGYYMTAKGYFNQRVILAHSERSGRFQRRGSFKERDSPGYEGAKSYESIDHPGYFLMCSFGKLMFFQPTSEWQNQRASFTFEETR